VIYCNTVYYDFDVVVLLKIMDKIVSILIICITEGNWAKSSATITFNPPNTIVIYFIIENISKIKLK